ncbi:MAG: ParB/RepB/Spo0J family partition protein [Hyphomicrobiales bacterium]|nr:ParB/RepB/Spo0J family partition protein [Hyphomicrobiales bacterium]
MAAQKRRLGRGLASLIDETADVGAATGQQGLQTVPIESVRPNPHNPRSEFDETELSELADSIREKGLVQPLLVRPTEGAGYELVAGERRWRAAQMAALHKVPVIVRTLSDQESLELAIIENVQRADLNAMEEARGYKQLMDRFKHTQEGLSSAVGKSRSHVANTLRLMKLPESVQTLVEQGALSAGHARALVGRSDAEALARKIVARGLNVRDVEALVQQTGSKQKRRAGRSSRQDADTRAAASELADALGLTVKIKPGPGETGEVRIGYQTLEQLEGIRTRILSRANKHK